MSFSIFDSISSAITDLDDWLGISSTAKSVSSITNDPLVKLGKAALTGIGTVNANAKTQGQTAKQMLGETPTMPYNQSFDAGKTGYGLEQFAGNAASVENYWRSVLKQFGETN